MKPETIQENKTQKILMELGIKTNHSILTKRSNLVAINKKKRCQLVDFTIPAVHWVRIRESKKKKKKKKNQDLAWEFKK